MVLNNLITGLIPAVAGAILPFLPKLFVRTYVYARLVKYYFRACLNAIWISPNSVNYNKSGL